MAVLLPLAMLLLGKTLSKTKQHKAVCFAVRSLPSLLHGADDICKFSAPPREQKSRGALELQCWQAVGTHLPPSLASGGMLGWKLHPRASPAHIKALSHVTDLGHIFKRQPIGCSVQDQAITEQAEIPCKNKLLGNLSGDGVRTWGDLRQFQLADQLKFISQENRTPHHCPDLQLPNT